MDRLAGMLADLGAGFGDVVKMNRWYAAAGTTDAWEPSARAVAAYFAEPGPVATAISLPGGFREDGLIRIDLLAIRSRTDIALAKHYAWPRGHWDWPIHLSYKHGVRCGAFTFVGGQVSIDEQARVVDPDDLPAQTERSLRNVARVLGEFGMSPTDLVRLWAYYAPPHDPPGAAGDALAARMGRFAPPTAVLTCVTISLLPYPGCSGDRGRRLARPGHGGGVIRRTEVLM
jgi:enamine deaminase RidA (YjgF/YER057c/UK114 family)